ncbi:MAG: dephospho-CoA kinase [Verrucomicrobia bacterium]|nr:dephospho-CoA kinase [Verrucomicrobiota bacterium]MBV9659318.1 dephospho-CoA kinase [Verrucomicrobiota bacterium]
MPLIGITGGVATGKSTVTRWLQAHLGEGARVFSSDEAAREILDNDADALAALRAEFGDAVFHPETGVVRRETLRELVFANTAHRRALEAILHPRIRARWTNWARSELQKDPQSALLVEIPLLYETGAEALLDRVVTVACSPATQWRRLLETRRLPAAVARGVLDSQLDLLEKIRRCDHLIWNDDLPPSSAVLAGLEVQIALCARGLQSAFGLPTPTPAAAAADLR